jgi:hypothetical protein
MSDLEHANTDGHAKFTGDCKQQKFICVVVIQVVSKEVFKARSRNAAKPFGGAATSRRRRLYEPDAMKAFPKNRNPRHNRCVKLNRRINSFFRKLCTLTTAK